jgi:hypothetical protein
MSGALEGIKTVSRTMTRYVRMMPFKMASVTPRPLSAQPNKSLFIIIFMAKPARLHKTRTIIKISPKLINERYVRVGTYAFK